jgi:hypothetical protein
MTVTRIPATRICKNCRALGRPGHFDVDPAVPRPYPGNLCDGCAEKYEENAPDPYGDRIRGLLEGDGFFVPATPEDPRPWETLGTEIKRTRWANLYLKVERVHEGHDRCWNPHDRLELKEPVDGAWVRRFAPGYEQRELFPGWSQR